MPGRGQAAMKYAIVIPDGAADEPQESLGGKTPLQAARTPEMDADRPRGGARAVAERPRPVPARPATSPRSASSATTPRRTTPAGPRSKPPRWAIALGPDDWAIRCNLMTIGDGRLTDFTAGHITSEEGPSLIGGPREVGLPGGPRSSSTRASAIAT